MNAFQVPTIPNSPLSTKFDEQKYGVMKLRLNTALEFVENAAFDQFLASYDDNYQNSQAYSGIFKNHMRDVLDLLKEEFPKNSKIVEVGCGKGDFVELISDDGYFHVHGYDAAYDGHNPLIQKRYLSKDDRLEADLIVLRHVLEHIKAPHEFLSVLKIVFGTAKIYVEVPNYDWIAKNKAFFDITYEHVNYFSTKSLGILFDDPNSKKGLLFEEQYQYVISNVSQVSDNFAQHYNGGEWEDINFDVLFPNIAGKISEIEKRLDKENKFYIWGAATKGCMFLVHCANRAKLIDKIGFAVDANPNKCGKFLPGSLVPIESVDRFFEAVKRDDVLVISNQNYELEIVIELEKNNINDIQIVTL